MVWNKSEVSETPIYIKHKHTFTYWKFSDFVSAYVRKLYFKLSFHLIIMFIKIGRESFKT